MIMVDLLLLELVTMEYMIKFLLDSRTIMIDFLILKLFYFNTYSIGFFFGNMLV